MSPIVGANCHGFILDLRVEVLTDAENNGNAGDTRVYTGLGLREDKNPTSCVRWCIMIRWVETPSTPPFIGQGCRLYKDMVGYSCTQPKLYLYLPIL
jgi:hypothetical protein